MPKRVKARPVEPRPLGEENYPTADELNGLPDKLPVHPRPCTNATRPEAGVRMAVR